MFIKNSGYYIQCLNQPPPYPQFNRESNPGYKTATPPHSLISAYPSKGIATMKTNKNNSQVNTKLLRSSLEKNEDTPVVRSNGKNAMLLFCY